MGKPIHASVDRILRESLVMDFTIACLLGIELIFYPNSIMNRNSENPQVEKFVDEFEYTRLSKEHQVIIIYCALQVAHNYHISMLSVKTVSTVLEIPETEIVRFISILMSRSYSSPN